nr:uncharacterized protein LOC124494866 [Dermatophagoides farinae]
MFISSTLKQLQQQQQIHQQKSKLVTNEILTQVSSDCGLQIPSSSNENSNSSSPKSTFNNVIRNISFRSDRNNIHQRNFAPDLNQLNQFFNLNFAGGNQQKSLKHSFL